MSSNELKYFGMSLTEAIAVAEANKAAELEESKVKLTPYPNQLQEWKPTQSNPWPMNFMQAPSYRHQRLVTQTMGSCSQPMLQGLSTIRGPFAFPVQAEPMPDIYQGTSNNITEPFVTINGIPVAATQSSPNVTTIRVGGNSQTLGYPNGWSMPGPFQLSNMTPFLQR